jgi:periplasmic protein TonB
MEEMSPGRRLIYALTISLLLHFFALVPLFGGGQGGRGGPRRYAGSLMVSLVDLTVAGAHAGVAPTEPEPAEVPATAIEPPPAPSSPLPEREVPVKPVKKEKTEAPARPPAAAMPSLSTEASDGGEAGTDRGPGTGKDGLIGDRGLGLFPGTPAPADPGETERPSPLPGGTAGRRGTRPGGEQDPPEAPAPAPAFRPARCASCPPPPYPPLAAERGLEGEIVLAVQVLGDGNVGDVYIEKSPGVPLLETAAITAVKAWIFFPATEDDQPVASTRRVTIPFTLNPR